MQLDTFEYPLDEQKLTTHIAANRIGKERNLSTARASAAYNQEWRRLQPCQDCGRFVSQCPEFRCWEGEEELEGRYGIYGPNCVIYLGYIKRIALYMLFCFIAFGVPMMVINLAGTACQRESYCIANNLTYRWSVYNILGVHEGMQTQAYLWLAFSLILIPFTYYLRHYTLTTYRNINSKNTTDSDYSLILRRLPPDTTPEDIRQCINEGYQARQVPIRDIIMLYKQQDAMNSYQEQLEEFKELMREGEQGKFVMRKLDEPMEFGNAAIVRFGDKKTCLDIAKSAQTSLYQKLLNYICVFYKPKTHYSLHSSKISLEIAPHPSDLLYQNIGYSEYTRIVGKILVTATAFAILILSSAIALAISYWIQLIVNDKSTEPILLIVVVVLVVLVFNKLIRRKVMGMTRMYKLDNRTDQESQQIALIVFHESLNMGFFSVIAPILVKLPEAVSQKTTKSSSFPTVMYTTILIQALFATILHYLIYYYQLKQKIRRTLHNRQCRLLTQSEASQKLKGTQVPFVKRYAFNVKMVWFGFLYGVVSPICILVAAMGMVISYFGERLLFNSKYSIPFYGRSRINYEMIDLLDWTPFLIGLFNLFLYKSSQKERQFQSNPTIILIYFIIIALGIAHLLIPWTTIVKHRVHSKVSEINFQYNPALLELTYEQSNPLTRPTPNVIYRETNVASQLAERLNNQNAGAGMQPTGRPAQNKYYKYVKREGPAFFNMK